LEWVRQDEPLEPTPKDKFRLRVYLSDMVPDDELVRNLEAQMAKRREKLDRLSALFRRVYDGRDPAGLTKTQRGDYLVLRGAIMRETTYIEWLQDGIALVAQSSSYPALPDDREGDQIIKNVYNQ
jgi:hypothetical protein